MKTQLGHLGLQALDHRNRGVLVEVVDDQNLERPSTGSLHDPAQGRHDVFPLVVNRDDDAERGRVVDQIRPALISSPIQGITSPSISSSEVVASNPSTLRALRTSGTRICTSCSYGASETRLSGRSGPCTLRQMTSASSRTVVDSAVERLKSSLRAFSDSMAMRIPRARSPPYV